MARAFYVRNGGWGMNEKEISISRAVKIPYQCGGLWVGKRGRLEVLKDELSKRWYAHIPVEVEYQPPPASRIANKRASLDVGICNLAALYIEGERPVIYSGRAVLSDWIYHTKEIADRQSKLPRKIHTSKHIRLQFRRRQRRLKHAVNAMLRDIFAILEEKVSTLYIGDLNGVREGANRGWKTNQKIHNFWVFSLIEKRIFELGEEYGITVRKVSERDTSKTCRLCGRKHNGRVERGLMVCRERHKSINADVNGAVNILNVAVKRSPPVLSTNTKRETSGSRLMAQPLLLRWNYHEWR